jgi:hypothetical protein
MDKDHDQYICRYDVEILLRCVTRGFSRLKQIAPPPMKLLLTIVKDMFKRNAGVLNEEGSIHMRDLRAFLLIDDKPRTYLATLGTLIVAQDISKLIEQRSELLKELYQIENYLNDRERVQKENYEKETAYLVERGGDSKLINLSENIVMNMNKTSTH